MNPKERRKRFDALKSMPCITCPNCGQVEIHHLNAGSHAGQKRLGDEFTIPLGAWAHRGVKPLGVKAVDMERYYGPSLARSSKAFHERYGSDEALLELTNKLLEGIV